MSVLLPIAVATGVVVVIVVVLVGVLLAFERWFIPHGPFQVSFERDSFPAFSTSGGGSLQVALSEQGVFLPAGCGGAGTCGLCRVVVVDGGGDALPTERALLRRGDLDRGVRLACQVKLRSDLVLSMSATAAAARQYTCTVVSTRDVATFIREITLAVPDGAAFEFQAGGFVQIHVPEYEVRRYADFDLDEHCRAAWWEADLLELTASNEESTTRAYSLANPPEQADRIVLNVRIALPPRDQPEAPPGVGSSYLYSLHPGDTVKATGPFGDFHIRDSDREMVYIGGGAGMAPLRSHILHLFAGEPTSRKVSLWYGARSKRELFYDEELRELAERHPNFSFHVALSAPLPQDDWEGDTGMIHEVIRSRYIAEHPALDDVEFYLCGPPLMLAAARDMLEQYGVADDRVSFDDFGG